MHKFWQHVEQVVTVIWHKAVPPPHTDDSIVFAGWRERARRLVHPNWHLHCTDAAPWWVALSISTTRHVWSRPWPSLFVSKLPHNERESEPPSNTWFLGLTRVHIPNVTSIGSAVFARLKVVTDRPTDRPRYSVCSNKPHLASPAMRPKDAVR